MPPGKQPRQVQSWPHRAQGRLGVDAGPGLLHRSQGLAGAPVSCLEQQPGAQFERFLVHSSRNWGLLPRGWGSSETLLLGPRDPLASRSLWKALGCEGLSLVGTGVRARARQAGVLMTEPSAAAPRMFQARRARGKQSPRTRGRSPEEREGVRTEPF